MRKMFFGLSLLALGLLIMPSTTYAQYGGGGGGGSNYSTPPTLTGSLKINSGATSTTATTVTLTMPTTNADQMAISNDSSFTNVSWQSFSSSKSWVLTPSYGAKTVYAMFRISSTGASTQSTSATITLQAATTTTTTQTSATAATTATTAPTATTVATGATNASAVTTVTKITYTFTKYLALGSSGTEVTELQNLLKSLGYFTGTVNGSYGSATKAAVIAFQKANKLAPYPGHVGPATRAALSKIKFKVTTSQTTTTATTQITTKVKYKFNSYLAVGSSGEEVKQLQLKLKELGYFTYATATGYFGTATKDAVVKYQKAKNLAPYPGYVGPGTRTELNK